MARLILTYHAKAGLLGGGEGTGYRHNWNSHYKAYSIERHCWLILNQEIFSPFTDKSTAFLNKPSRAGTGNSYLLLEWSPFPPPAGSGREGKHKLQRAQICISLSRGRRNAPIYSPNQSFTATHYTVVHSRVKSWSLYSVLTKTVGSTHPLGFTPL